MKPIRELLMCTSWWAVLAIKNNEASREWQSMSAPSLVRAGPHADRVIYLACCCMGFLCRTPGESRNQCLGTRLAPWEPNDDSRVKAFPWGSGEGWSK
jgi:hypothetical protein